MKKVSIIVPVYNAEDFLENCINSIIHQNYSHWELILVDDGSQDSSGNICDKYVSIDSRIKVIHKINEGVSAARNDGLKMAIGDWVMFVDADDALENNALDVVSCDLDTYDIIRFSAKQLKGNPLILDCYDTKESYMKKVLRRDVFLAIWGGLYRKSLFEKHKIEFDVTLQYGEDWLVLVNLLSVATALKVHKEQLYIYNNINETSCLNTMHLMKQMQIIQVFNKIEGITDQKYKKELLDCLVILLYILISSEIKTGRGEYRDIVFGTIQYPSMLKIICSRNPIKYKIVCCIYKNKMLYYFIIWLFNISRHNV